MALIVVGSANIDLVIRATRLPVPGETIMGTAFATFPGGKGANQALAAGRLQGDVRFVGCVGDDAFGPLLRESLVAAGVWTDSLAVDDALPTGVAVITVDAEGQNTIVVAAGANASVRPEAAIQGAGPDDVILAQLEIPIETVEAVFRHTRASLKILNPAPARELPADLYSHIDVITPNEVETEILTGVKITDEESWARAASELIRRGTPHVIITLGGLGCYYASASVQTHHPAWPVAAIDTVAAGDAFSGTLALFLSQGKGMDESIRMASIAAALSTTKVGAQDSMPSLQEMQAAIAQNDGAQ